MQQIGQILQGQTARQRMLSADRSSSSTLGRNFPGIRIADQKNFRSEVEALRQRFPDSQQLLKAYNPDTIKAVMRIKDLSRIYQGAAPTLFALSEAYGIDVVESWIEIQLNHLSDFIGVKEKLNAQTRSLMASLILSKHGDLKMSEFLYFIGKIMAGSYTRFYGEVNGQTIMFYLQDFIKDREADIARIEKERERQQRAREQERWKAEAVTYETYLKTLNR